MSHDASEEQFQEEERAYLEWRKSNPMSLGITTFRAGYRAATERQEKRIEELRAALEKLYNKHLSGHTMDFRPCETCDIARNALKEDEGMG